MLAHARNHLARLLTATVTVLIATFTATAVTITIDHNTRYQTIVGFGGSTGHLSSTLADMLMNDGGVSALRIDWCEVTDPNIANAKICYDIATEKPTIIGSCWSPPANMKDNGNLNNGGHLLSSQYNAFGDYTVSKLRQFKQAIGVDLYSLCPQNEPQFAVFYASCVYTGSDLIQVMKIMGQKIATAGLPTKIHLADDMYGAWSNSPFFPPLMADVTAQSYINAMSFHGYTADGVTAAQMGAGTLANMYRQCKTKGWELWQTENGSSMNMGYAWDVIGCLRYGKVSLYMKYGLVGDAPGMVGTVDEYYICQGQRTRTFYAAKVINKFIRRGAVQLKSTSSDSASFSSFVAFHDPNRNALAISMVTGAQAQSVQLAGTALPANFDMWVTNASTDCIKTGTVASSATISIPANSAVTLYATGYNPPTGVRQARGLAVGTAGAQQARSGYRVDGRQVGQSGAPVVRALSSMRIAHLPASRLVALSTESEVLLAGTTAASLPSTLGLSCRFIWFVFRN